MSLPTAPSRTMSQDAFDMATDAFIGALPQFEVDMNALATAMALNSTTDTSASSVAIGTGSKTFTVSASKSFVPGMWLIIADSADPTVNAMYAQVSSYSGTTLIVNSAVITGSGTKTAWQISQTVPATSSVLLAGDQTIDDVKRFTSPVGVAAAAAAGDAVRKDQLTDKIQPITSSVDANALTATLNPTTLDFRDATLTSGNVNTRIVSTAINCVVPSTATLGTVNAVQSDIVLLAIDNVGTVELAVVNLAGGNDLSETGLISTTALSAGSDSANVVYSTTARTNVPYRVVGIVRSTQATAGTWATAPSLIQGSGGQAITAMSSLGYGQTWQNMTASRAVATTYYNTTGRPIEVAIQLGGAGLTCTLSIDGAAVVGGYGSTYANATLCAVVPPSKSYSVNAGTLVIWSELR